MKAIRFDVSELGVASKLTQDQVSSRETDPSVGLSFPNTPCVELDCRLPAAD